VYSQFKEAGVYRIAKWLKDNGWHELMGSHTSSTNNAKHIARDVKPITEEPDQTLDTLDDLAELSGGKNDQGDKEDDKEDDKESEDESESVKYAKLEMVKEIGDGTDGNDSKKINDQEVKELNKEVLRESKDVPQEIDEVSNAILEAVIGIDNDSNESDKRTTPNREPVFDGSKIHFQGKTFTRGAKSKTFAILDGDVPIQDRRAILDKYNSSDNIDGQILSTLLVTTVGSRGINLQACRHTHYYEPYWYMFRYLQFKARAVRDGSHLMLPEEERNVQPFIYLSTIPEVKYDNFDVNSDAIKFSDNAKIKALIETDSTDITLYDRSVVRQYILDNFTQLLKEVSIECPHINEISQLPADRQLKLNCITCAALGNKLFSDNIHDDVISPNPCKMLTNQEVETTSITVGGIKYEYTRDNEDAEGSLYGLAVYEYDTLNDVYKRVSEIDKRFTRIYEEIIAYESHE
jgi:hypothetical protein